MYIYVHHMCASSHVGQKGVLGPLELVLMVNWLTGELLFGCWELNPNPL